MGLYLKMTEDYLHWLEARGSSLKSARLTVVSSLTMAAMINAAALGLVLRALGGPRVVDWMVNHFWVFAAGAILCGVWHWRYSRGIHSGDNVAGKSARPILWTIYILLTIFVWVGAAAITIVSAP